MPSQLPIHNQEEVMIIPGAIDRAIQQQQHPTFVAKRRNDLMVMHCTFYSMPSQLPIHNQESKKAELFFRRLLRTGMKSAPGAEYQRLLSCVSKMQLNSEMVQVLGCAENVVMKWQLCVWEDVSSLEVESLWFLPLYCLLIISM
jgi:hypothetical protein